MIRPAQPEDVPFIASAWLQSYASSPWAELCTPKDERHTTECGSCGHHSLQVSRTNGGMTKVHAGEVYWRGQRAIIARLLASANVCVYQNPDGLLDGFIARDHASPVLHYVYVRASARGRGVARALIDDLRTSWTRYTHRSRSVDGKRVPQQWTFDPSILMVGT